MLLLQYCSGTLKDLHNLFKLPIIIFALSKNVILQFSVDIYKLITPPFITTDLKLKPDYYNIM